MVTTNNLQQKNDMWQAVMQPLSETDFDFDTERFQYIQERSSMLNDLIKSVCDLADAVESRKHNPQDIRKIFDLLHKEQRNNYAYELNFDSSHNSLIANQDVTELLDMYKDLTAELNRIV